MQIEPLSIEGAWRITPRQFPDDRGVFLEAFRGDHLADAIGHPFVPVQSNVSVSSVHTVRGVHFAQVPPSQAKYVTVLSGALLDVVVDIRVGSPTFGRWDAVRLDTVDRLAVFVGPGLGHALIVLEPDTTAHYLVDAPYTPGREHGVTPLDPALGLPLPATPLLSPKDEAAPTLDEAARSGLLPTWEECHAYVDRLRR